MITTNGAASRQAVGAGGVPRAAVRFESCQWSGTPAGSRSEPISANDQILWV